MTTRKNLIIVRAGERSLHSKWLDGARTWDLFVSDYRERPSFTDGEFYTARKGGCWSGNAHALEVLGERVAEYDFIACANDDLRARAVTWNRLFEFCARGGVDFGHPAVLRNTHPLLFKRPGFIRPVPRLPDIHCPVLSRRAVAAVRHTFAEVEIGLGLLWVWPHLCPTFTTAIIDAAVVEHTRPIGSGDRAEFEKRAGVTAGAELAATLKRYGIKRKG